MRILADHRGGRTGCDVHFHAHFIAGSCGREKQNSLLGYTLAPEKTAFSIISAST